MRRAGILLHPTSLPGPHGLGDIGPAARRWLQWLESAGQTVWQVLPLNPVDFAGSPYSSPSAFARNPLLLSLDDLVEDGWLTYREKPWAAGDPYRVDFPVIFGQRPALLAKAADRVRATVDLTAWSKERRWAQDWGLFSALLDSEGPDWREWPEPLRHRDRGALAEAWDRHAENIERHIALQWLFDHQWGGLRAEAERRGVEIWGDLPLFVNGGSCDVWAHRELFRLDADGYPTAVSGVPPDIFAELGQLWGHPLFAHRAHEVSRYQWWTDRLGTLLELVHTVRLDHFRGLVSEWESEADAADARGGRWIPGFGAPLLDAFKERFGRVPLIAEDLGIITPEVRALRDAYQLPGMAVLQFAFARTGSFEAAENPYLPHNHQRNLVVYTGTHDNDTAVGWYLSSDDPTRDHVRTYLGTNGRNIEWDLIRWAYRSVSDTAVVPMQDILSLDGRARMNVPGRADGNWSWRMGAEALNLVLARKLRAESILSGRVGLSP
jgi:4-alpha-glucanotransferase